jgi:septal ring factor EnvC (AmiA/AmiB activator)
MGSLNQALRETATLEADLKLVTEHRDSLRTLLRQESDRADKAEADLRALMARCEQAELDAAESQAHAEQLAEALDTLLGESYNDIDQENAYAALAAWREKGSAK